MKYALIGCGRIAPYHMQAALDHQLQLTALCDLQQENMDALLHQFSIDPSSVACYTDHRQLLANHTDVDLCAIATQSGAHAEIAMACIRAGKHVLIEKPMAMSLADADEIIRLSQEMGVIVGVCHQNRFNEAVQQTRAALEAGRFGAMSHGSIHVRWMRDESYYQQADWRGTWEKDGGCLMNQCIHGIDLLRWMLGDELKTVYGCLRQQLHPYLEAEDIGMAVLQFANGAIATIEGTTNTYPEDIEEILYLSGEHGTVKIGGQSVNRIDYWKFADENAEDQQKRLLHEQTKNIYGNGHSALYADLIDAIQQDRRPYVDAIAGRNALETVLAIYCSQKTGLPVQLPLKDFASVEMAGTFGKKAE